ncbi:MAG: hypothetical protein MJY56_08515 [Bacteroidales bacterium]|nr:hypothetical protein [Bacteroidales bacterium]
MLNRRILRIKVFKTLYASSLTWDSTAPSTLADSEKFLKESCEKTRELYLLMLGIVSPITRIAAARLEAAKNKIHLTEEDLNPNTKFAENALAMYLDGDRDFRKAFDRLKFDWNQYDLILKKTLNSITGKPWFKKYMEDSERSLKQDCALFTHIFEEEFVDSEELAEMLEGMSIYWNDELAYALTWCCRTLSELAKGGRWSLPELYQSDMMVSNDPARPVESDRDFSLKLLRAAYAGFEKYSAKVAESVSGWEKDRLVTTDMCLIVCCLAEVMTFPSIPTKVSINEYVEISKYYGTPKSSIFVNGLIDRLVKAYEAEGLVKKN